MKAQRFLLSLLLCWGLATLLWAQRSTGLQPGDEAPDFELKNVDGQLVSLADYKQAKGFIIVFTCNHCPFAKLYEDRIIALHNKYAPKGFPVVAINPNDATKQPEDSFEMMIQRAQEKSFPYVYLQDATQEIARTYGAARTPHVWILQKQDNKLKVAYVGGIDNSPEDPANATEKYVERAIEELLAGRVVSKNTTKAIGCTIKWRN
ncbi:MAG: thioredoxin family protein [Cytophagales bacterium]|nr:thioredoxin family protein [Bernardetiaceae bacterium]MDW8203651.1 thioredoxin family protein [Cytophagales bacterium]